MAQLGVTVPRPHEGVAFPSQEELRRGIAYANQLVIDLSTAREREEIRVAGRTLWCIDGNGECAVRLGTDAAPPITFSLGMKVAGIPFGSVYITNDAQAGAALTFLYTDALVDTENPARFQFTIAALRGTSVNTQGSSGVIASGGTTLFCPSNTERSLLTVSIIGSTANPGDEQDWTFKSGAAPGSFTDGFRVRCRAVNDEGAASQIFELFGRDDWYARNNHASLGMQFSFVEYNQ